MGLLSVFRRDRRSDEERRFGRGLWRQHRDRFSRVVDRFYETTSTLHRDFGDTDSAPQIDVLSQLTLTLNDLDERVAWLSETAQREVPLDDLVFPAAGRARLGDVPEHLSRASALVAQAAQSAAMLRAGLVVPAGTPQPVAARFAESARTYVVQADRLIAEAEAALPPDLRPQPGTPSTGAGPGR